MKRPKATLLVPHYKLKLNVLFGNRKRENARVYDKLSLRDISEILGPAWRYSLFLKVDGFQERCVCM